MLQKEFRLTNQINKKKHAICHYWYFKDIGCKFEPNVCTKFHDISLMADEIGNTVILNIKCVDYRCLLLNITRNDAIDKLNNSKLDDKGTVWIRTLVQITHSLK